MGDGFLSLCERFQRVPCHPAVPENREEEQLPEERQHEEAPATNR